MARIDMNKNSNKNFANKINVNYGVGICTKPIQEAIYSIICCL